MFYHLKVYWQDRWIAGSAAVLALCQLFMWIYTTVFTPRTQEHLFLHYNIIFGVDLAGEWWRIFFVPLVGLFVFFANFGASWFFYGEDKILARFLSVICAVLNLGLAWSMYLILALNI